MLFYDQVNAAIPDDIERKTAHIIGGGISGLAAAAFLATDAHMPAGNITVYEDLPVLGGSMDGTGGASTGYVCRGERELERTWSASGTSVARCRPSSDPGVPS